MNYNSIQNTLNPFNFSLDLSLLNSAPVQIQNEVPKSYNNITVLNSDDDNSTPKTNSRSHKISGPTIKRTQSQLTEKAIKRRSTKSVLNSNFSLEDHLEPESAETDYNSPVASQNKQAQKTKQIQRLSSNSQRKISQTTQINQSQSNQKEETLNRKKSFFEELEEIAFSFMTDTNKKIKFDDSQTQTSLSTQSKLLSLSQQSQQLSQSQSQQTSNLINLIPILPQPQYQQYQQQLQYQSQQQYQQLKIKQPQQLLHYQQPDLIQVQDDQNLNNQLLNSCKLPAKKCTLPAQGKVDKKKQTKINQKQKQRGNKQQSYLSINDIQNNNDYQNNIPIQNNQQINCQIPQINFPIQPKPILLNSNNNQNSFKFQQPLKKIQPPRVVFAEEVYLKSISLEGSIKLQKFPCFKESDLQIPTQFSQLIQQFSDDDKCSGDELLEKAVNFMHKKLVESTVEQNPSAVIPDAQRNLTILDIKIDRESDDEEEEEQENQQIQSNSNNYYSQYSPYRRQSNNYQNNNDFLTDEELYDCDD